MWYVCMCVTYTDIEDNHAHWAVFWQCDVICRLGEGWAVVIHVQHFDGKCDSGPARVLAPIRSLHNQIILSPFLTVQRHSCEDAAISADPEEISVTDQLVSDLPVNAQVQISSLDEDTHKHLHRYLKEDIHHIDTQLHSYVLAGHLISKNVPSCF